MTTLIRSLILLALLMAVSGCGTGIYGIRDQAQVDPVVTLRQNKLGGTPVADYPRCSTAEWIARASSGLPCGKDSANASNELSKLESDKKSLLIHRNAAQAELMIFSDLECAYHKAGIYSNQATLNFITGMTSLIAGAAAIVSDASTGASGNTARNLTAIGTVSGGTRGMVNSEIYYSHIGPAVISEIELLRRQERKRVLDKQRCSIEDYPPARAINDALEYHESCSFVAGLASLLAKAGKSLTGGDIGSEARNRSVESRIAEIERQLTVKRTELAGLPADDVNAAARDALRTSIAALEADVARWKDLQALAGPTDPPKTNPDLSTFAARKHIAQVAIVAATAAHDSLPADNPQRAARAADLTAAKKVLTDLLAEENKAKALPTQIAQQRAALDRAQDGLTDAQSATPPDPNRVQAAADRVTREQGELTKLQNEQKTVGLPDEIKDAPANVCLS